MATGAIFTIHGVARLKLIDIGGPTIESTAKFNSNLGLEPGLFWSYYVTGLELIGGLLLVGFLTRSVAALIVGFLFAATFYVTSHFGFLSRDGDAEYALVLLVLVLSLLVRGGGAFSLDRGPGWEI